MKLFLDQDVYALTCRVLRASGHDVVTASEAGLPKAADSELLAAAELQGRILVTRDRDFGGLVFLRKLGAGVIYLRMGPAALDAVHEELRRVLDSYPQVDLEKAFVVVEPGRHRFRRLVR